VHQASHILNITVFYDVTPCSLVCYCSLMFTILRT